MSNHPSPTPVEPACPVNRCAEVVCGKWTMLVIRDLFDGPKYFRELEISLVGISPRTLCDRLKFLTERGLVSRTYIKALPPRTQYALTEQGEALESVVEAMREFGLTWVEPERPIETLGDSCSAAG